MNHRTVTDGEVCPECGADLIRDTDARYAILTVKVRKDEYTLRHCHRCAALVIRAGRKPVAAK